MAQGQKKLGDHSLKKSKSAWSAFRPRPKSPLHYLTLFVLPLAFQTSVPAHPPDLRTVSRLLWVQAQWVVRVSRHICSLN